MPTRRRAQDLTPAELEARQARDRAAQQRKRDRLRGTDSRDTVVDNAGDSRDLRGTDSRDTYREGDAERTATYRENVPRTYRDGRGTTTVRESSYREPSRTANDVPRTTYREDDDDGKGATWPNGRRPLAPEVVNELGRMNARRGAARDWEAIARCGLCDANGFVTVEDGTANGGVPTVAFCAHGFVHTLNAARERADLD